MKLIFIGRITSSSESLFRQHVVIMSGSQVEIVLMCFLKVLASLHVVSLPVSVARV